MSRQLVIVRAPLRDVDAEYKQLHNVLNDHKDEYLFIIIQHENYTDIQFEYPKNVDLPQDELDKIKNIINFNQ